MTHFLSCIYIYTSVPVMCLSLSVLLKMLNMLLCKNASVDGDYFERKRSFERIWINVDVA